MKSVWINKDFFKHESFFLNSSVENLPKSAARG